MAFEYLFTSLPPLPGDPGGRATLEPSRLAALCAEEGGTAARLVHAILMRFDLKALERMEFGSDPSETAVFSVKELEERTDFPEWLAVALGSEAKGRAYAFDRVWDAYFRELERLAGQSGSNFLRRWVSWEVGLRNAIVELRASRAGVDSAAFLVDGISDEHPAIYRPIMDSIVSFMDGGFDSWRDMDNYVNTLMLQKARTIAPAYTFNTDELLSYATQFVILRGGSYLSH
jgi:hypothetical protein